MALRMAGVARVTVSLRRSARTSVSPGASGAVGESLGDRAIDAGYARLCHDQRPDYDRVEGRRWEISTSRCYRMVWWRRY